MNSPKQTLPGSKTEAVQYFHDKADQYSERYSVRASGDVLWDRHRAILQMVDNSDLSTGSSIIDLGCGPGFLSVELARKKYRGVGLDGAAAMVERCRRQAAGEGIGDLWQYEVGDVEAIPFEDALFDAAICAGVIEYLPRDQRLISEAARVLRPGGRFILCVTNKYGYTVSLYSLLHMMKKIPGIVSAGSLLRRLLVGGKHGAMNFGFLPRKQRPKEIRKLLIEHGFRIEEDRYLQFTLLPAPFCAMLSRLKLGFEEKLDAMDRTPLRIIGSCYIAHARK